jgi:integration host factor subunit alpha
MTKSDLLSASKPVGPLSAGPAGDHAVHETTRTITRADLAEAVYRQVGLSRKESGALVQSVLGEIADTLCHGEPVKLSSFGAFLVREKKERIGRNPKTGVAAPITERKVLTFKPSSVLKARVNGKLAADEDE